MLTVEKVNTFYGEAHILFDMSLQINEGETVCLLGRNGAGKTTLVRSIMGLTPAKSGSIIFKGEDITHEPPYEIAKRGIGFVADSRRIFPNLSVRRNLEVGRKEGGGGHWDLEAIYGHFPQLKGLERHSGEYLSGGEQQMLAIARTLMGNPELILLDEPSEGLAPFMVMEVMKIIKELKESGMSILLVEQYSTLALEVSDRSYVLDRGHIVYAGGAKELYENRDLREKLLGI
ncbi:MAG: ABC transporter ATP-binding protein [Deltaproteobacteria bacterium]|nr:MAG: ABC transporter ATP-binding protein [Deltaproteobacteria bacterium]